MRPRPSPPHRLGLLAAPCLTVTLSLATTPAARADGVAPSAQTLLVAPRTIEHSANTEALLRLPAGPEVQLRASSGTLEPATKVNGAWVARYRPGAPIEPGAVIFHATRTAPTSSSSPVAAGRCGGTWVLTRRSTRAVHPIRTKPLSVVAIYIGGHPAGSATADELGRATVTTLVEPDDTLYEIRAQDRLKNENARTLELPSSVGPPPLLAEACQESVRAGESVMVEVAAVDRHAHPVRAEWIEQPGITIDPVEVSGFLTLYRITVDANHDRGTVELALRNDNAQVIVRLEVSASVGRSGFANADEVQARRAPGVLLGATAGAASNLAGRWGLSSSAHLDYRPRSLAGRLRPRLVLGCIALWGSSTSVMPPSSTTIPVPAAQRAAAVDVLALPMELGLAATLLRAGSWEIDLSTGVGAAWLRVRASDVGYGPARRSAWLPSVSAGLALRRRGAHGALLAQAGWRQLFRTTDTTEVEAGDNRGMLDLAIGGELDL